MSIHNTSSIDSYRGNFASPIGLGLEVANNPMRNDGPLAGFSLPHIFESISSESRAYPEAFNKFSNDLGELISGFAIKKNSFATSVLLPWGTTSSTIITWSKFTFKGGNVVSVPNRAVPRLTSTSQEEHQVQISRYGIGFEMEQEYLQTDKGKRELLLNCKGISELIQEAVNYDVISAILNCKLYNEKWFEMFGTKDITHKLLLEVEAEEFACLAHDYRRFEMILEKYRKAIVDSAQREPDALVVPSGSMQYVTITDSTDMINRMDNGGPEALARQSSDPMNITTFRRIRVFETIPRLTGLGAGPTQKIDQLVRTFNVGEYYIHQAPECLTDEELANYKSCGFDFYTDDMNRDRMHKMTFMNSFDHCGLFNIERDCFTPEVNAIPNRMNELERNGNDYGFNISYTDVPLTANSVKQGKAAPFVLATRNSEKKWTLATHFGKIGHHAADFKEYSNITDIMVAKLKNQYQSINFDLQFNELIQLLNDLENQPYDKNFLLELSRVNGLKNTSNDPNRNGERAIAYVEFEPNEYGGLNLPMDGFSSGKKQELTFETVIQRIPIGYANGPGLLTLASHSSNPSSPYYEVGKRARNAVVFLKYVISHIKKLFPESQIINPKSVSPWFVHDEITALISHIISTDRDPIFLLKKLEGTSTDKKDDDSTQDDLLTSDLIVNEIKRGISAQDLKQIFQVKFPKCMFDKRLETMMLVIKYLGDTSLETYSEIIMNLYGELIKTTTDAKEISSAISTSLNNLLKLFFDRAQNQPSMAEDIWKTLRTLLIHHRTDKDYNSLLTDANLIFEPKSTSEVRKNYNKLAAKLKAIKDESVLEFGSDKDSELYEKMFYRTPLTMSMSLLNALKTKEKDDVVILPGNPGTHNMTCFIVDKEHQIINTKITNRPNYYDIYELQTHENHRLDNLAFMKNFIEYTTKKRRSESSSKPAKKAKKMSSFLFDEDDEDACPPEEFEEVKKKGLQQIPFPYTDPRVFYKPSDSQTAFSSAQFNYATEYYDWKTESIERRYKEGNSQLSGIRKILYMAFIFAPSTAYSDWKRLIINDIRIPLTILLFRPCMSFDLASFILMVAGLSTGTTMVKLPHTGSTLDPITGRIVCNFTWWHNAIVQESKHIRVVDNPIPRRYLGGCGSEFFEFDSELDLPDAERPSFIALPIGLKEAETFPKFLSVSGFIPESIYSEMSDGPNRPQYSSYELLLARFPRLVARDSFTGLNTGTFSGYRRTFPSFCAQGPQVNHNPHTKMYDIVVPCLGHRKIGWGPGAVKVYNQTVSRFIEFDPNKHKLL
jgi:hypothetical protein